METNLFAIAIVGLGAFALLGYFFIVLKTSDRDYSSAYEMSIKTDEDEL